MYVEHLALWVDDLAATRAFYVDALGFEVDRELERDGETNLFLTGPQGALLQCKHHPDRTGPFAAEGFDHFAVRVDDIEAEFERIVAETGCAVGSEPEQVSETTTVAFIEDPDGYGIELVERSG